MTSHLHQFLFIYRSQDFSLVSTVFKLKQRQRDTICTICCGLFAVRFSLGMAKGLQGESLGREGIGTRRGSIMLFLRSRGKMVVELPRKKADCKQSKSVAHSESMACFCLKYKTNNT